MENARKLCSPCLKKDVATVFPKITDVGMKLYGLVHSTWRFVFKIVMFGHLSSLYFSHRLGILTSCDIVPLYLQCDTPFLFYMRRAPIIHAVPHYRKPANWGQMGTAVLLCMAEQVLSQWGNTLHMKSFVSLAETLLIHAQKTGIINPLHTHS